MGPKESAYHCFSSSSEVDVSKLDREPFTFQHDLSGHPALELDNLAKIIAELPEKQVNFAKALVDSDIGSNFFQKPKSEQFKNDLPLKKAIENIETSKSFINIIRPETHPTFKPLFDQMVNDISGLLVRNGTGQKPLDPITWLFIASPNAITPYHYDCTSNFLFQFRGSKEISIFKAMDPRIISVSDYENVFVHGPPKDAGWTEELDHLGQKFQIKPKDAVHIPFTAGHYVKNGPEDVSITLSIFYQSNETQRWSNAARFNNRFRDVMERRNINLKPIMQSAMSDRVKSMSYPVVEKLFSLKGRISK